MPEVSIVPAYAGSPKMSAPWTQQRYLCTTGGRVVRNHDPLAFLAGRGGVPVQSCSARRHSRVFQSWPGSFCFFVVDNCQKADRIPKQV